MFSEKTFNPVPAHLKRINARIDEAGLSLHAEKIIADLCAEVRKRKLDEYETVFALAWLLDDAIEGYRDITWGQENFQEYIKQISADDQAYRAERSALWSELDVVHSGDILLIKIGEATWKLPADQSEFVKSVLPVFAKKQRYGYAIYKSIGSKDVGVHRLFVRANDDERVAAFDGDFTNFCTVKSTPCVTRNFGLTPAQLNDPKFMARYPETIVPNLYIVSSDANMSHGRMQADFERRGVQLDLYNANHKINPNADLGTRAGTPNGIQDAGKYRPPTNKELENGGFDSIEYIDRYKPAPQSARMVRAAKELDKLFKD